VTPPPTIVAGVMDTRWFRDPTRRRLTFAVAALILAVLCIWPRQYTARADLMPDDSGGGLSSLLGGGGAGGLLSLGALLGNHQSIEADLTIGRSQAVLRDVVVRLRLVGREGFGDLLHTQSKLREKVDVAAIRGSILQITVNDRDPAFARAIVSAYVEAIQDRLTSLNLQQATQKRVVATNRMSQAVARLTAAQTALADFRNRNRLAAPEAQLGAAVSLLAQLQGKLQAKQVELATLRQFATSGNVQVQAAQAEIVGLQGQIAEAQARSRGPGAQNLAGMAAESTEYLNLYRDERFADALYEIYRQALEKVTIDELSANVTMDVIEPPYVDPARQYNTPAVGLLVLVILLAGCAEYYVVAPPIGRARAAPPS